MSATLSPSASSLSASSSSSSPIVLKPMKNIFGFGNESGISTTSSISPTSLSVILMKRKKIINNINNINTINTINNNIFDKRDDIDISIESNEVIPDDYYHRHRERKLEYQKNYNRENDDKIKEYNKDYYLKRRAEILEKAKTRVICECGCDVQLSNMNAHKKTKKHLKRVGN